MHQQICESCLKRAIKLYCYFVFLGILGKQIARGISPIFTLTGIMTKKIMLKVKLGYTDFNYSMLNNQQGDFGYYILKRQLNIRHFYDFQGSTKKVFLAV